MVKTKPDPGSPSAAVVPQDPPRLGRSRRESFCEVFRHGIRRQTATCARKTCNRESLRRRRSAHHRRPHANGTPKPVRPLVARKQHGNGHKRCQNKKQEGPVEQFKHCFAHSSSSPTKQESNLSLPVVQAIPMLLIRWSLSRYRPTTRAIRPLKPLLFPATPTVAATDIARRPVRRSPKLRLKQRLYTNKATSATQRVKCSGSARHGPAVHSSRANPLGGKSGLGRVWRASKPGPVPSPCSRTPEPEVERPSSSARPTSGPNRAAEAFRAQRKSPATRFGRATQEGRPCATLPLLPSSTCFRPTKAGAGRQPVFAGRRPVPTQNSPWSCGDCLRPS